MDPRAKNQTRRNQQRRTASATLPASGESRESRRFFYRIKIKGRLGPETRLDFKNFTLTHEGMNTLLTGPVEDQAALHGFLARIRDFNWTLLLVERLEPVEENRIGPGPDVNGEENEL